jgi:hypothetical protein
MTKNWIVIIILTLSAGLIAILFWHNEWKYSLPTPVPAVYHNVYSGTEINLADVSGIPEHNGKPLFLHFFNPGCPCSRFNAEHVKSLIKTYKDDASFAIVVMAEKNKYTAEQIQDRFNAKVPVLFDNSIAETCGVYSTPQAVIINKNSTLVYRGNYNKARYCTDKNTEFARIALESLLNDDQMPEFGQLALTAYGCKLPVCPKN